MQIIFIGFSLRLLLSIINIYIYALPGSQFDAIAFHEEAILVDNYLSSIYLGLDYQYEYRWAYSVFLGLIYFIFGQSIFLASFLSCVAWLLSALIFRLILIKLNFSKDNILYSLILYCLLLPISMVYSSFVLREVYILLFYNLMFLSLININLEIKLKNKFKNLLLLVISCFLLSTFHVSSVYILSSLILIFIAWLILNNLENNSQKTLFFIFCIIFLIFLNYEGYIEKVFSLIRDYQKNHFVDGMHYRAQYYNEENPIFQKDYSFFGLIHYIFINFFNYFMQPTFVKVSNLLDFSAFYENALRVLVIFISLFKILNKFNNKNLFIILLLIWLISEAVYAQVTVNWGTASRHHMPGLGLMIILLFFPLRKKL